MYRAAVILPIKNLPQRRHHEVRKSNKELKYTVDHCQNRIIFVSAAQQTIRNVSNMSYKKHNKLYTYYIYVPAPVGYSTRHKFSINNETQ